MPKHFISFETETEEVEYDDEQSAVQPIFVRIVQALEGKGAKIVVPPSEWDAYGWYAEFQVGAARLICMMQRSDAWLVMVFPDRTLMDRLKRRHYAAELDTFSPLVLAAVQEATGVPAKLYRSETEYDADRPSVVRSDR